LEFCSASGVCVTGLRAINATRGVHAPGARLGNHWNGRRAERRRVHGEWLGQAEASLNVGVRNPHFFEWSLPIFVAGTQIDTNAHGATLLLNCSLQNSGRPQLLPEPLQGLFLLEILRGDALLFKEGT